MNRRVIRALVATVVSLIGLGATRVSAESCFDLPDAHSETSRSSSRKVTLGARVTTKANCEYALLPDAAWVSLGAVDSDFATLIESVATQTHTTTSIRPTAIYARSKQPARGTTASQPSIESLFLAGCSEYLLSEAHGFSLRVPIDTQRPTVTRERGATACGADQMALYFVAMASATTAPLLSRGPYTSSLPTTADEIVLEPGAYAIYAARNEASVGYLVGRVATGSSLTPLRDALHAVEQGTSRPWLRAAWKQGRMQLEPVSDALRTSDAWSELRTAAAASAAWLQRHAKADASNTEPVTLGKLRMSADGDAIYLPVDEITRHMTERYGTAGQQMAPNLTEWNDVAGGVDLCVAQRYALPQGTLTAAVGAQCIAMSRLLSPMAIHGGGDLGSGQVCVRDNVRVMTTTGTRAAGDPIERCAPLQTALQTGLPTADTTQIDTPTFLLVTRGSQLRFDGQGGDQLFACLDNDCQPLPANGEMLTLERSGLLEIRHADSRDHARSAQALTRLRIGVIDPEREWHPVGLYTSTTASNVNDAANSSWHKLLHDADHTFTYSRRGQQVDFRLSLSPTLAAAWNLRGSATTQLTQDLPVFGGVTGSLEGARPPALVTLITTAAACPEQPAGELAQTPSIDPERLMPDQDFYVQLAQYTDQATPLRCLARAHLRVVAIRSLRGTEQIRIGLLGDVQLQVFITRPTAIGLALPLVYGFWRWGYGFGLDASIALSTAITFDPSQISRSGLMASTALVWGPERIAPRLLSFGVAFHAATGTHEDKPFGSVYTALNLSSLVDLAGGR